MLEDSGCLDCLLPMPTTTLLFTARGRRSPSSSSSTTLVLLPQPTQSTLWPPPLPVSLTLPMSDFAPTLLELLFLVNLSTFDAGFQINWTHENPCRSHSLF